MSRREWRRKLRSSSPHKLGTVSVVRVTPFDLNVLHAPFRVEIPPEVLMIGRSARAVVISLVSLLLTSIASAQSADTTHKFSGSGDIGFVNAAGNTDVTTLNVGEELTYSPVKVLRLAQSVAIVYGRTNGVESASLWHGSVRGDRDDRRAIPSSMSTSLHRHPVQFRRRTWRVQRPRTLRHGDRQSSSIKFTSTPKFRRRCRRSTTCRDPCPTMSRGPRARLLESTRGRGASSTEMRDQTRLIGAATIS